MLDYDPVSSLESIGYSEREASFLYLVAVHSGYFVRRQYYRFAGREGGTLFARLLSKAAKRQHLRVIECGHGWHVYHLVSKPVYEALGRPGSQDRRIKSDAHIKTRLMVLDFILANLRAHVLEDEHSKVDFFTTQCSIVRELLPNRYVGRLLYFPDRFPILITDAGIPRFTFFDEGQVTVTRFERFLSQHQPLFVALGEFELIYAADVEANCARASIVFNRFLPSDRPRGVTSMTPMGVEHFIEYLGASERYEANGAITSGRDLEVLREGEHLYASLEHRALEAAWNNRSTSSDRIRQRFLDKSLRATLSTIILPYNYPTDALMHSPPRNSRPRTPVQTSGQTLQNEGKR